ncbi:MAG TPA: SDR family oxidoreductase [Solirubrobacterales bacterium]|nr:SDR family oxidoreductase [Solirubrobacterales bacterium]
MIAVVTAAGREPGGGGLGAATCAALCERGYAVIGWDEDAAALERTAATVPLSGTAVVDRADVEAIEQGFAGFDEVPNLVVNNLHGLLGSRRSAPFAELAASELEEEVAATLVGASVVCLAAVTRMKAVGRGAIVNVTSALAPYPAPLRLVEAAAAAAIESLTASLGAELGSSGIRVNAAAPAAERSSATATATTEAELATLIALLGSAETAAMNGTVVRADPGFDPFPGLPAAASRE